MPGKKLNLTEFKAEIAGTIHGAEELVLRGIASSPGLAFGRATIIQPETLVIPLEHIEASQIDEELIKFDTAVQDLVQEFMAVLGKVRKEGKKVLAVLESNMMVLTDSFMLDSIKDRIRQCHSVESAVILEFDSHTLYMKNSKDQILKERAIELDHVKERLLFILRNKCLIYAIKPNSIVVAQAVTPTEVVNFKEARMAGMITEIGGITSHSSILMRSFELPEVIGVKEALSLIKEGNEVIIDGYTGTIIINPSEESRHNYELRKQQEDDHKKLLGKLLKLESKTTDNRSIHLLANVDFPEDVESAVRNSAEGIGLVRSEHQLISLQRFPDEEEQYKWYCEIADRSYPNNITIRAFDVGSDKFSEGMPKHEDNPALGFRGIRFLLFRKDIYKTQVRAVLRASRNKNIRLMLPMISGIKEIQYSMNLIEEAKIELTSESQSFDANLPVGIMIETPAAAILADKFAEYAQFFSIGTNDLTQYTLAVDRNNEMVSEFFNSFHPSVIKLIKTTVDAAKPKKIPVGICGELASHSAATALLIGLGVTELSVSPSILLELKNRVRNIRYKDAKKIANEVLACKTYDEIRKVLGMA